MQRNTPPLARRPLQDGDASALDGKVRSPLPKQMPPGGGSPYSIGLRGRRTAHRGTPWFVWTLGGCLTMLVVLVIFCAALVGTLGGLAFRFASSQDASDTKNASWTVTGAPALRVESDAATIHVQTGNDGVVRMASSLSAHAASENDARAALKKITLNTSQAGNAVSIDAQTSKAASLGVSLSVTLVVTVPRLTSVVIVLASGDAVVDGVNGSISTSVTNGSARLTNVVLTAASLVDVQRGDATVAGTMRNGASLDLQVASGDASVSLPSSVPVTVDAATSAGNVTISGWAASPGHNGSGSSVHVETVSAHSVPLTPTCSLSIHVQSGDIALQFT